MEQDIYYDQYLEETNGKSQEICTDCGQDHAYKNWLEDKITAQNTSSNSDYAKCPSSKACHNYPNFTEHCKVCIRLSGLSDHFA